MSSNNISDGWKNHEDINTMFLQNKQQKRKVIPNQISQMLCFIAEATMLKKEKKNYEQFYNYFRVGTTILICSAPIPSILIKNQAEWSKPMS